MVEGQLQIKDHAREYIDRGDALENLSYLVYFLETYDGTPAKEQEHHHGRNPNTRVPYREGSPSNRHGHCRVIRSAGHETMPYFPGQWFAKRDEEDCNGLFEASMLALLKPWRTVAELKHVNQTFREAYEDFVATVPTETRRIIKNIQFFHECSESARQRSQTDENAHDAVEATVWTDVDANLIEAQELDVPEERAQAEFNHLISEADIDRVLNQPFSPREQLFAEVAITIGLEAGVLREDEFCAAYPQPATRATDRHLRQFQEWKSILDNSDPDPLESSSDTGDVLPIHAFDIGKEGYNSVEEPAAFTIPQEISQTETAHPMLNSRQTMAHTIITNHLRAHLAQKNPPQRLVIVHGQGGTGKSALLNAISKTFADLGASALLAKTATSGVAASIIGGQTLHTWAALPIATPHSDKWVIHPSKQVERR